MVMASVWAGVMIIRKGESIQLTVITGYDDDDDDVDDDEDDD